MTAAVRVLLGSVFIHVHRLLKCVVLHVASRHVIRRFYICVSVHVSVRAYSSVEIVRQLQRLEILALLTRSACVHTLLACQLCMVAGRSV